MLVVRAGALVRLVVLFSVEAIAAFFAGFLVWVGNFTELGSARCCHLASKQAISQRSVAIGGTHIAVYRASKGICGRGAASIEGIGEESTTRASEHGRPVFFGVVGGFRIRIVNFTAATGSTVTVERTLFSVGYMVTRVTFTHADGAGTITTLHVGTGVADIPVLLLKVLLSPIKGALILRYSHMVCKLLICFSILIRPKTKEFLIRRYFFFLPLPRQRFIIITPTLNLFLIFLLNIF